MIYFFDRFFFAYTRVINMLLVKIALRSRDEINYLMKKRVSLPMGFATTLVLRITVTIVFVTKGGFESVLLRPTSVTKRIGCKSLCCLRQLR